MPERRSVNSLNKAYKAAIARQMPWLSTWRDAYKYALPQRSMIEHQRPGQVKGDEVFDSTAVNSNAGFANRLAASLFPPWQDFFKAEPGPMVPDNIKSQARQILQEATERFHALYHRSNFQVVFGEMAHELGIGTGAMLFMEGTDENPFRFAAAPIYTVALEPGDWGSIWGIYRKHKVPVGAVETQWPTAELPREWKELKREDPTKEVTCIEVTYFDPNDISVFRGVQRKGVWWYDVFLEDVGKGPSNQFLLKDRERHGTRSGPWLVPRWTTAPGEVYGRGPLLYALPDIRTINKVKELTLRNAAIVMGGIWTGVDDGVFNPNTARIFPGAIVPVQRNPGHPQGPSIAELARSGTFDLSQFLHDDLQVSIQRALFDRRLPPDLGQPRTATEIIERVQELAMDIGPAFGRLQSELVDPLIMRGFEIMARKGIIQFPFVIDGSTIDIQLISPLAKAQNLGDVEGVMNTLALSAQLGQEMVMYNFLVEDLPAWIAGKLGFPEEMKRPQRGENGKDALRARIDEAVAMQTAAAQASLQQPAAGAAGQAAGQAPGQGNGQIPVG